MKSTLEELVSQKTLKFIFVGGKGGVGKTTTSSSIAIQMAKARGKTLIISTDPAHNLSDAFNQQFSHEPTKVEGIDNLFAIEIDPKRSLENEDFFQNREVFGETQSSSIHQLISQVPGIDEAIVFMNLLKLAQNMDVEVVIFDTAPTGHTLKMLSFPKVIEQGIVKIMEFKDKIDGMISLMGINSEQMGGVFSKMTELKEKTDALQQVMKNPSMTTFVAVCIPEFLSVYETERLVQELTVNGIDIYNIVVNQIVFPDGECKKCMARYKMQSKYIKQIQELYEEFHLVFMKQEDDEIRGVENLSSYGAKLLVERTLPKIDQ